MSVEMTPEEWRNSNSPLTMLHYANRIILQPQRKLRLLICAIMRLPRYNKCRFDDTVLKAAEYYADGQLSWQDAEKIAATNFSVGGLMGDTWPLRSDPYFKVCDLCQFDTEEDSLKANLMRCLFEYPSQYSNAYQENPKGPDLHPSVLSWNNDTVPRMAKQIYTDYQWETLPVLADALEEAGCPAQITCPVCLGAGTLWLGKNIKQREEPVRSRPQRCWFCKCKKLPNPLLTHCRGPGPHARGCWVLDRILGENHSWLANLTLK